MVVYECPVLTGLGFSTLLTTMSTGLTSCKTCDVRINPLCALLLRFSFLCCLMLFVSCLKSLCNAAHLLICENLLLLQHV